MAILPLQSSVSIITKKIFDANVTPFDPIPAHRQSSTPGGVLTTTTITSSCEYPHSPHERPRSISILCLSWIAASRSPLTEYRSLLTYFRNHSGKAFIPAGLIGKGPPDYLEWKKADTFFSEYELHNPRSHILSESEHSYIIGNNASYDARQYPLPPTDKRPEGQGYCHTLVIPKERVYNAADPKATENDCFVLKELRDHFIKFWSRDSNKHAMLARAEQVLENRHNILTQSDQQRSVEYTPDVARKVMDDFGFLQHEFLKLDAENFIFGFHVYPENSIGHLHMHVFPIEAMFRWCSTRTYDYKTVPLQAILDVEEEDRRMTDGIINGNGTAQWQPNRGRSTLNGEPLSSSGHSSSTMDLIMNLDTPSDQSSNAGVLTGPVQPPDTSPPGADQPMDVASDDGVHPGQ
ncbi:MAG: hypothetical protein Q9221_004645 [Calogaya cf. arnoldii]